jgi:hypothetical protein
MLAVRLALERQVLGVGDQLQMVRVPAGMDAALMMELLAFWNWAAEEFPAESVGVAVLCLGDPPVRGGRPGEQPAGSKLRVGRSEDGQVDQAFELGVAGSGSRHVSSSVGPPMLVAESMSG